MTLSLFNRLGGREDGGAGDHSEFPWPLSDGLGPDAPRVAQVLALLSSLALGALLPVLMVVANKSAPATLGAAALFANLAALFGGKGGALRARYRALARGPAALLAGAVVLLMAASLGWSIDRTLTLRGLVEGLPELAFALAAAAAWPLVARLDHVRWLIGGLVAAAALIALERLAGFPLHKLVHARDDAASLKRSTIPLVLLLWPALGFCFARGRKRLGAGLAASAVLAAVVAHSGASGLAIGSGAATFAVALLAPRIAVRALALVLAALIVLAPWTGTLAERLPGTLVEALSAEHAADRIRIWAGFEARARDRPLVGYGFDTSFKVTTVPRPDPASGGDETLMADVHPHNILLQIWVELGLFGAMAAAVVAAFTLRRAERLDRAALPFRLGLLGSVVAVGLVGLSAWQAWWIASIVVALLWFELLHTRLRA